MVQLTNHQKRQSFIPKYQKVSDINFDLAKTHLQSSILRMRSTIKDIKRDYRYDFIKSQLEHLIEIERALRKI